MQKIVFIGLIYARIIIHYLIIKFQMPYFRPTSYERPGDQISTTPAGIKITSAKNLMIDSMVRMIQQATNHSVDEKLDEELHNN